MTKLIYNSFYILRLSIICNNRIFLFFSGVYIFYWNIFFNSPSFLCIVISPFSPLFLLLFPIFPLFSPFCLSLLYFSFYICFHHSYPPPGQVPPNEKRDIINSKTYVNCNMTNWATPWSTVAYTLLYEVLHYLPSYIFFLIYMTDRATSRWEVAHTLLDDVLCYLHSYTFYFLLVHYLMAFCWE